jgi:hypothetical protein
MSSKAKGLALIKDNEDHDTRSKLSRYEAGLMNAVARTLSLIQAIQASGATSKKMNIARGEHLLLHCSDWVRFANSSTLSVSRQYLFYREFRSLLARASKPARIQFLSEYNCPRARVGYFF